MRVTPLNIARFWKRLMFPPDTDQYRYNRLVLKADMPWEPWLHAGAWCAFLLMLVVGDHGVVPPIDGIDWWWVCFGLTSPVLGFFSVWVLEFHTGRARYFALWGRMIADFGLAVALLLYQIARFSWDSDLLFGSGILPNIVLFLSMWFTATLVVRDIRFIVVTERVAAQINRYVHHVSVDKWAAEWGDDAVK